MDAKPKGERGEGPGKRPPLPLSKVSASWGPVVHTLPLALRLLSLLRPAGRPVLPPWAVLPVSCQWTIQQPWQEQRLQGKWKNKHRWWRRESVCSRMHLCHSPLPFSFSPLSIICHLHLTPSNVRVICRCSVHCDVVVQFTINVFYTNVR